MAQGFMHPGARDYEQSLWHVEWCVTCSYGVVARDTVFRHSNVFSMLRIHRM